MGFVTDNGQPIAPAQHMHPQLMFDLGKVAVKLTAQAYQQTVVGKFKIGFHYIVRTGRGGQRANAQ